MTEALALWFAGSVVFPDTYTRVVDWVWSKDQSRALRREVRRSGAGVRRIVLIDWANLQSTRSDLIAQGPTAYERLVQSLIDQSGGRLLNRRLSRERAERAINAAIENFISTLPPSQAVDAAARQVKAAIADHDEHDAERQAANDERAEARHQELVGLIARDSGLADSIDALPGAVRAAAHNLEGDPAVLKFVRAVAADSDPAAAVRSIATNPPPWLLEGSGAALDLVADTCHSHGHRLESAHMFLLAAATGSDAARRYARAAGEFIAAGEVDQARGAIASAEPNRPNVWIDIAEAQVAEDLTALVRLLTDELTSDNLYLTSLRIVVVAASDTINEAIRFARLAVDRFDDSASFKLRLAELLAERGKDPSNNTRTTDFREARDLAIASRDQLRTWGGDSEAAARTAAEMSLLLGDFDRCVALGVRPPAGEATPREAGDPELRAIAVLASLHDLDLERARSLADSLLGAPGFLPALARADVLAATEADNDEIETAYRAAWSAAENPDHQQMCLLAMTSAGIEDLPALGDDAVADDFPVLLQAQTMLTAGDAPGAIATLRAAPITEMTSRLLVLALRVDGDLPGAAAEAIDAAERLGDPVRLVEAVEMLVRAGDLTRANDVARDALIELPAAHPARSALHGTIITYTASIGAWHDMIPRARAWIADSGFNTTEARWALVMALNNDGQAEEAWQALIADPELQPTSATWAHLWVVLAARFLPGPETRRRILDLVDEHDDPELARAAIGAFLVIMRDAEEDDPDAETQTRFAALMESQTKDIAEDPDAPIVRISGTAEEMIDQLRPQLEARARAVEEVAQRVRDGYPYGLFTHVSGYTAALIQRAAGCLTVASADPDTKAEERVAAAEALGNDVSLDPSAAVVGWYLRELWPAARGQLARLELAGPARRDAAEALVQFRQHSAGHLSYVDGAVRLTEQEPEDEARLLAHAEWVDAELERCSIVDWTELTHLTPDPVPDRFAPWMAPLDLAKAHGTALWSDDVGQRSLAAQADVPAFGTVALLEVLVERGVISADEQVAAGRVLRDEYAVDLPLDMDWMRAASARQGWETGPAAFQFCRPATWANETEARAAFAELVRSAAAKRPELVIGWAAAAAHGIVRLGVPAAAGRFLAHVGTLAISQAEFDPGIAASTASTLRAIAVAAGLPSPTRLLVERLYRELAPAIGPVDAAVYLRVVDFDPADATTRDEFISELIADAAAAADGAGSAPGDTVPPEISDEPGRGGAPEHM